MKAQIAVTKHAQGDLQRVLTEFGIHRVHSVSPLRGGFSGTNYLVKHAGVGVADGDGGESRSGVQVASVLKFCNGYDVDWVHDQIKIQLLLAETFDGMCTALPRSADVQIGAADASQSKQSTETAENMAPQSEDAGADENVAEYISTALDDVPSILLSFVGGRNASHVCHDHPDLADTVMAEVGSGLAAMHVAGCAATVKRLETLRSFDESGCCNLYEHLDGSMLEQLQQSPHTVDHE